MKNHKGRTIVERECSNCKASFWAEVGEVNRGKGKVCSKSCAAALTPRKCQKGENNANWKGGGALSYRESKRKYRNRHPQKVKAHMDVRNAIKTGLLVRGVCEVCSCEKVEAHHDDYNRPLYVRWLCKTHHKEHHVAMRDAGIEKYYKS